MTSAPTGRTRAMQQPVGADLMGECLVPNLIEHFCSK
jgi:hypothetical protein